MTTAYPGGIDNFTNPTSTDTLSSATVPHASEHANANDAIKAIETELGTNPKGSYASVSARLAASTGSITTWRKAAAGGETSLSGTDDFSTTLAYTVGQEQVFINGVLLERGVDYTATTGSSITGLTALVASDIATVISVGSFNVANAIPLSTVTTKGDLIAATGASTVANVGVGADGTTLVANSSASTGVSWAGPSVAAGKNKIINGDFGVWQRGTSFAATGTPFYTADRWGFYRSASAVGTTVSRQASTLTGFQYVARVQRDSGNTSTAFNNFYYSMESADAYQLAGKVLTFSFWARCGANYLPTTSNLNVQVQTGTGTNQNIIYGYTGPVDIANGPVTLTSTWTRFTITTNAVATNATELGIVFGNTPVSTAGSNDWYEIAGVQLEIGSVATAFQTATGTLQGELTAAQRYFMRYDSSSNSSLDFATGAFLNTSLFRATMKLPVTMRTSPTAVFSAANLFQVTSSTNITPASIILNTSSPDLICISLDVGTAATAGFAGIMRANTSTSAFINLSAEL